MKIKVTNAKSTVTATATATATATRKSKTNIRGLISRAVFQKDDAEEE